MKCKGCGNKIKGNYYRVFDKDIDDGDNYHYHCYLNKEEESRKVRR